MNNLQYTLIKTQLPADADDFNDSPITTLPALSKCLSLRTTKSSPMFPSKCQTQKDSADACDFYDQRSTRLSSQEQSPIHDKTKNKSPIKLNSPSKKVVVINPRKFRIQRGQNSVPNGEDDKIKSNPNNNPQEEDKPNINKVLIPDELLAKTRINTKSIKALNHNIIAEGDNANLTILKPDPHELVNISEQLIAESITDNDLSKSGGYDSQPEENQNVTNSNPRGPISPFNITKAIIQINVLNQVPRLSSPSIPLRLSQRNVSLRRKFKAFLLSIHNIEPKLSIIRAMSISIVLCLSSLALLFTPIHKGAFPNELLILMYLYLGYRLIENIIRIQCTQRAAFKRSNDIFDALETAAYILLFVSMKYPTIAAMVFLLIFFIVVAMLDCFYGKTSKTGKVTKTVLRILSIPQIFLALALLNELYDDWNLLFVPCWLYIGFHLAILIISCLVGVMDELGKFITLWTEDTFINYESLKSIAALVWHFVYGCFYGVVFLFLYGFFEGLDSNGGLSLVKNSAIFGLVISLFLIIFTLLTSKYIIEYIELNDVMSVIENPRISVESQQPSQEQRVKIVLQAEELEKKFFLKSSDSYFIHLELDALIIANKIDAKEKMVSCSIKLEDKTCLADKKPRLCKMSSLETNMFNIMKNISSHNASSSPNLSSQINRSELVKKRLTNPAKFLKSLEEFSNTLQSLSNIKEDDDADAEDEETCYVCCLSAPNAILMNCGHGGICHKCAVSLVKKKTQCLECRTEVEGIAQVDKEPMLRNVFKTIKFEKVMKVVCE